VEEEAGRRREPIDYPKWVTHIQPNLGSEKVGGKNAMGELKASGSEQKGKVGRAARRVLKARDFM